MNHPTQGCAAAGTRSRLGRLPKLDACRLHHLWSQEDGQVLILAAVSLVALILFIGLVFDAGKMRLAKSRLQTAADVAAIAAGLEIRQCGTANCPAMQAAARSALQENGYADITVASNCANPGTVTGIALTINNPPCALGAADPNTGKNTAVEVVVSSTLPLSFEGLAGMSSITMAARSEAARATAPPCVYALDPHAAGAISITAGALLNFTCGLVDESDSSSALSCVAGPGILSPSVQVTGGASGLLCGVQNLSLNVPAPVPADPLAYLLTPTWGACGSSAGNVFNGSSSTANIVIAGTYTFNPGVYCGGISVSALVAGNITFNPGVYVLATGPGPFGVPTGGLNLALSVLSNLHGAGVTFYNVGPIGGFNINAAPAGLSNVSLSAPSGGPYGGILFFQDPGNASPGTSSVNLLGGSKLEGAWYLPAASLTYGVAAASSTYNIIVAKDINFAITLATTFGNDYSALSAGSPINGNQVLLAQ